MLIHSRALTNSSNRTSSHNPEIQAVVDVVDLAGEGADLVVDVALPGDAAALVAEVVVDLAEEDADSVEDVVVVAEEGPATLLSQLERRRRSSRMVSMYSLNTSCISLSSKSVQQNSDRRVSTLFLWTRLSEGP